MPRKPRQDPPGGWHHVMNRGVDRMNIFRDAKDRRTFLYGLSNIEQEAGAHVAAYCLVGNHFHLMMHCPAAGLSDAMWKLGSDYARSFNRRHGRDGPLFRGRFAAKLVETDDYLTHLLAYIHNNSTDLGIAAHAWQWSSYNAYIGTIPAPAWLRLNRALAIAGGRDAHRRAVEQHHPPAVPDADDPPAAVYESWRARRAAELVKETSIIIDELDGTLSPRQNEDAVVLALARMPLVNTPDLAAAFGFRSDRGMRLKIARAEARQLVDVQLADVVRRAWTNKIAA